VKLADLRRHLPKDTPVFTPEQRKAELKAHDYKLADFGLTEADIEAVCGPCLDSFGVAREERR
jgi:hypothetical protein